MSENSIKVAIAGINGKMGRASLQAVVEGEGIEIAGAFGSAGADYISKDLSHFYSSPTSDMGVQVSKDIKDCLASKTDVLLEFTRAESAIEHAEYALSQGVRPVIGTSGLSSEHFEKLSGLTEQYNLSSMVIPNFSVGAVLMMEFAKQAGKHFKNVEILEMHGTKKLDAPSGTATYTAAKLAEVGQGYNPKEVDERELLQSVRGGQTESGVRIHSMRLPGLISHQDVVFAAPGEMLSIRHNSFNTDCFLKGIVLSIRSIMEKKGFILGLENLL